MNSGASKDPLLWRISLSRSTAIASLASLFTPPRKGGSLTRGIQLTVKPFSVSLSHCVAEQSTTRQELTAPWTPFRSNGCCHIQCTLLQPSFPYCISDPLILFFHFLSPSISCFFSRIKSSSLLNYFSYGNHSIPCV